jgi:glycosyltransferase involved in cell wall biosynthesis
LEFVIEEIFSFDYYLFKMNILVINWQDWKNPLAGGAEIYLYEIFSRLRKKGHTVILLCSRTIHQSRYEKLDGFEIYRIGRRSNFNFLVPGALRAIMRHRKIDIVIDDLNKIPFYSPLFTRKKVMPMLMHLFRSAIYRETNMFFASYVFLAERLIPYFYPCSNFVAISHSTAEDLKTIGIKNKIYVVQSGIPVIPSGIREARQNNLIAYVGRVKKYKSIDHFVKAVAVLKQRNNIEAVIVGDGDARHDLIHLSQRLNADIQFTGFISEEEKYRMYHRARVVVQPSIKEGWGLTAIEAQSCGTPVVCANSPGLREVIQDGKTGFLYDHGDINSLVQKLQELLDNEKRWRQFSSSARMWASEFSWDRAAATLEQIIQEQVS